MPAQFSACVVPHTEISQKESKASTTREEKQIVVGAHAGLVLVWIFVCFGWACDTGLVGVFTVVVLVER